MRESAVWADALLPEPERDETPVFSPLGDPAHALGIETIYEGYLAHYGRPRLFAPADRDAALLLGDYLYAHGLVRVAAGGSVDAVGDLAELISVCAHLRGQGRGGDGEVWAATAAALGSGRLDGPRAAFRSTGEVAALAALARARAGERAVERALVAHAGRVE